MKKNILPILFLFTLVFISDSIYAQDAMILRNKRDTLKVKILEIGTNEIKYKMWPVDESMPIMAENKDRIRRVILANGTVLKFSESEFVDPSNYTNQKKTAIKIDLFSILTGTTSISYEQSIKPGESWEFGLGIIGLGANNETVTKKNGAFFRGGYKFINQPDFYMKGMRYTHILKGGYIRPEIVANFYNEKATSTDYSSQYNSGTSSYTYYKTVTEKTTRFSAYALMLNFGKQWVMSDIFVVDMFVGGGIGYGTKKLVKENTTVTNSYSYYYGYDDYSGSSRSMGSGFIVSNENEISFAGQMGLKLGILIGSKTGDK